MRLFVIKYLAIPALVVVSLACLLVMLAPSLIGLAAAGCLELCWDELEDRRADV